jgi:NADH-quinone oxidoreductase subunit H
MNETQRLLADDPWWLVAGKAVVLFAFLVGATLFTIWLERRVVARMQMRIGPNRVGPFGLMQGLADGIKLALKEDIIPRAADRVVFIIAPIIATIPAFLAVSVIPFGPKVSIFGEETVLQLTDLPLGVLMVVAAASVGVYGLVLAGWSSGSTYPLLGGLRSSAQVISYEVAMSLSFVAVFLYAGSMSTSDIVNAQASGVTAFGVDMPAWYAVLLFPSFAIYCIAMVGETNRAPFDLAEAEGELVGGFHTEYSSLKFALFFLAEYINLVTVSALATTLFLGGWRAPWPLSLWDGANEGWWPILWLLGKTFMLVFVFIWLRGTLPRFRYDQFMKLGWKVLIPFALGWIVLVAGIRAYSQTTDADDRRLLMLVGGVLAGLVFIGLLWADLVASRKARAEEEAEAVAVADGTSPAAFDPFAGGYPVPPMPGQTLPALARTGGATSATEGHGSDQIEKSDREILRG